jgi:hypothetical protein
LRKKRKSNQKKKENQSALAECFGPARRGVKRKKIRRFTRHDKRQLAASNSVLQGLLQQSRLFLSLRDLDNCFAVKQHRKSPSSVGREKKMDAI